MIKNKFKKGIKKRVKTIVNRINIVLLGVIGMCIYYPGNQADIGYKIRKIGKTYHVSYGSCDICGKKKIHKCYNKKYLIYFLENMIKILGKYDYIGYYPCSKKCFDDMMDEWAIEAEIDEYKYGNVA